MRHKVTEELTDGTIVLRQPTESDKAILIAARDSEFHRFMGEGSADPEPSAVVVHGAQIVGWIDYDLDRDWLNPGEANIGYATFPAFRSRGFARRSLLLLLEFLAEQPELTTATLLIDPENASSLALSQRAGFIPAGDVDGQLLFKRPLP